MHVDLFQRLEISPCSVSALFFTRMGPRMVAYNDTGSLEHLKPKPEPPPEAAAEAQAVPAASVPAAEPTVASPQVPVAEAAPASVGTPPAGATEQALIERSSQGTPDKEAVSSNGVEPPEVPPGEHQATF